ncbi:MAG: alpha-L-fucosidase [Lewinellaceae bacterium]|nr:alpha-L-fucosidase [Lewinellaceae bacterium]
MPYLFLRILFLSRSVVFARSRFLAGLLFLLFVNSISAQKNMPGKQALPVPTAQQLAWHNTEFYLFFHFGPNTFTNVEWGHGTEPEDIFNPTDLDCDQWCRVAKQAGARGVVITAKHHDGFCLWPSQYSKHTVRESKWRDGKGDVLRELSEACRRHGLKFGVYLSPWDRNHPQYGTPEYNDVYVNTLTELLTGYGELFEIWWDGANGEGPNGKKQVYDFHRFEQVAARLQPNAVIFSDIGPGCRWVGNERGLILSETNWCTLDTAGFQRGLGAPSNDTLNRGNENGAHWIPAECDVSIRPGWFYHAEEDDKVKTPEQLWDIYLHSVGRGANLILNVPPDRRGRIHEQDSLSLVAFGEKVGTAFQYNLAKGRKIYQRSICAFTPRKRFSYMLDGDRNTYEKIQLPNLDPANLQIDLRKKQTFNAVVIREAIAEGQLIQSFSVEVWKNDGWQEVARSTTIGARKILRFPEQKARKIRIVIRASKGEPALSEVEVYKI